MDYKDLNQHDKIVWNHATLVADIRHNDELKKLCKIITDVTPKLSKTEVINIIFDSIQEIIDGSFE